MGLLEILLFVVGILIVVMSFRIPASGEKEFEETRELAEEEIKELVNRELENVREQVEGTVDETITYAVEKTERFMDRMTNEKMMAINEYSDTVLEEIQKNHKETMFLYDMLNSKHENVKSTAAEVNQAVKAAREVKEEVREEVKEAEEKTKDREKETEEKPREPVEEKAPREETEIAFDIANLGAENSNEEILKLHKEGKSNVTIAKELGLGVGEVKLVIDLFEGM